MLTNLLEGIGILAAAVVSLAGAYISIRNRKQNTRSLEVKTNLDETQQAKLVRDMVSQTEDMYLRRIESFKDDIKILRDELDATRRELRAVRDEAGLMEDYFFNHHVPWDRKFIQQAREKGWEVEDPPSWLLFLREKGMVQK